MLPVMVMVAAPVLLMPTPLFVPLTLPVIVIIEAAVLFKPPPESPREPQFTGCRQW
jgi:hypothetical protein